ncbi:MAG TPA: carboxypeptidase regulatory-like domain-containing protein [Pyrinomonadaceae bacterium]
MKFYFKLSLVIMLIVFVAGVMTAPEVSLARNEVKLTPVSQTENSQGQQTPSVPLLTFANAPNVPQCRGMLTQDMLDVVNGALEDPAEAFERNRRAHPHMIMMPPPVECESQLWKAARQNGALQTAVSPYTLSMREYSPDLLFNLTALTASVGANIDPSNGVEGYQGETSISIDPNNPQHIIGHSNTFFKDSSAQCQSPTGGTANTFGTMSLFGSTDGGATWTYNCAPWHTAVTGGVASANAWFGSDPALAWDASGRAYACYMLLSQNSSGGAGASIVVARSTDNGATWQQFGNPVVNRINLTSALDDKEMFAIDNTTGQAHSFPGRLYVIWDEGNSERIAHSDDGLTWTTVLPSSNTGAIGGNLVIGADGTVYAIWTRFNVETIVFSKSIDGGATWTAPAVIATLALQSFGANNLPPAQNQRGINGFGAIDVDRNPSSAFFGNLYVSFPDFPAGTTTGADLNTYIVRSTDGGTNWSTRVKVNDDNFGASQFFPWLAVDQSDGTVNVSWIDSRLDPLNRKTQAVYARSSDGGVSFEPNILVTDGGVNWRNNVNYADENSTDNPSFNGNQYGDYTGIAAFNRQVHPLWTDSRMFFPVADTQSPTRREDNATSTIINCSSPAVVAAPSVNPSTAPNVAVSWSAPSGWGTGATNGTYSVYRNTTPVFPGGAPLASGLAATNYVDTTGVNGTTYYYFVTAKNNCSGTALTPMSTDSPASVAVVFGNAGTPGGTLQGTVRSNGTGLNGVVVSAGAFSATTDGSGFYQFPAIGANTYTVSASPAGYNPAAVNGVVVTGGGTTVQDLALTPVGGGFCNTDTSFGDFSTGSGTNVDIASTPTDVKLANLGSETADQNNTAATTISTTPTATTWAGQTFRAGITGNLTKISVGLGLNSGSTGTVAVEIHDISGANPGPTVLATSTLGPVTNPTGTVATYTTTFGSPPAVVSGTSYSVVIKGGTGSVYVVRSGNTLANGGIFSTTNSGGTWTAGTGDLTFTTFVTPPLTYQTSGNFTSSLKDSGAVVGATPRWNSLSWNTSSLPAGTSIQFQVAASNNAAGPFNFVGPDNTAATFFTTSGASLLQFNGNRYLKYKALLSTSNASVTPSLADVTVCYSNMAAPTAANGTISGRVVDVNGRSLAGAVVNLEGTQSRKTITNANGEYRFEGVETNGFYSVAPSLVNYSFSPRERSFSQIGNATEAVFTGAASDTSLNAIDTAEYFVRQHYVDFLGREPDESGFNFWSDEMLACGSDLQCRDVKRINVSAAYFLSIEFQETGGLVDGLYRATYGRAPRFAEFMPDTAMVAQGIVVGKGDWANQLAANKQAFIAAWISRPEFRAEFDGLSNTAYVDALVSHAGGFNGDRSGLVEGLNSGSLTRASALRQVVENEGFIQAKRTAAFVMMEYFGYLRRDPDPNGYQFWLRKLDEHNGNFVQAEMVRAFIDSIEYRQRFGQ